MNTEPQSTNPIEIMSNVAEGFAFGNFMDLPLAEMLKSSGLDFSVSSLSAVDGYLQAVHGSLPKAKSGARNISTLPSASQQALVLRIGAYVGEVIRRSAELDTYRWLTHAETVARFPEHQASLGRQPTLLTAYAIATADGQILLPLNRVFKALADGPVNSTLEFAKTVSQAVAS